MIFPYQGRVKPQTDDAADEWIDDGNAGVFAGDGGIALYARESARALVISGAPLNEPVARHGPFVMNTHDELVQAVEDYNAGKLAPNQWEFLRSHSA